MGKIETTYTIKAQVTKVWEALTDPIMIEQWGAGPNAFMTDKVGEKFSLWDGDIYGTNIEVIENKLLKQKWYGGEWDKPSIVIFKLESDGDTTKLHLEHSDFPEQVGQEAFDGFKAGWDDFYFGPLKELVEG